MRDNQNFIDKWTNGVRGLIFGISIGVILTGLGTYSGVRLQQGYEEKRNNEERLNELIYTINSVYQLGLNVTRASSSKVFPDRWESYINNGYIPWLIKEDIYENFIRQNHLELYNDFDTLKTEFTAINALLVEVRRKQPANPPSTPNAELDDLTQARDKYKLIKDNLQRINAAGGKQQERTNKN